MHRAFSFPMSVERSRNKERLEDRLAGLCELELRKQRQECLVLGALAQGDPMPQNPARNQLSGFSSWGQENLTLRRQLSALQSSPWGLMLALEQQVSELRVDRDNLAYEGNQKDTDDSRPRSGFYESSEAQSPKERSSSSELTETASTWIYSSERPKSLGDAFLLNRESLPYSFSAPYPPLEGIAEEGLAEEPWQWDPQCAHSWEDHATEEDYQQALRVEGYILGLIQRHTLSPRTYHTRTSLGLDPSSSSNNSRPGSLRRKTSPHTAEHRIPDPLEHLQDSESQAWGYNPLEEEACGRQAPSTGDGYISLSYPHSRPHSLVGGLLPSLDPNCGALDACCSIKSDSPQHCPFPLSPVSRNHLISAQYIPGQTCHAPVCSPIHCAAEPSNHSRASVSPDHSSPNPRSIVKKFHELQSSKKPCHRTSHSQSENNLLGQQGLPERRYSTTERPQGRRGQGQAMGPQASSTTGGQRWCSTLELSQKEGDIQGDQAHRRPPRRTRQSKACSQAHAQPQHSECLERAPLCWGEGYKRAAPGESESSMSEVYSPASSSLSSDSDEGGGLVWPQQLPPRLDPSTSTSSSSSSPQVSSDASSQPKAFVKIKASHALKKKILRFRSGSLKVMTTV